MGFEADGRELLVIAVKATFRIPQKDATPQPEEEQQPLVEADTFTGEPGYSATLYESDYSHRKPFCDILLNGSAHAPGGRPVSRVTVSLQVGKMKKSFNVIGERRWEHHILIDMPSPPKPFIKKNISYDFAFGGADKDSKNETRVKTYTLNPIGVGYYPLSSGSHLEGKSLPNTEEINNPIKNSKKGRFKPMAFGPIGRNFAQRVQYAGTYNQEWLDHRAPFWPRDFDYRYFQAAPPEQRISYPIGGEQVVLSNLTPEGTTAFSLPVVDIPILIVPYKDKARQVSPVFDTVVFEPNESRFSMTARVSLPLRHNCFELKDVIVGETIKRWRRIRAAGTKPYYRGLSEFIKAQKARRHNG